MVRTTKGDTNGIFELEQFVRTTREMERKKEEVTHVSSLRFQMYSQSRYSEEEERCSLKRQFFAFE